MRLHSNACCCELADVHHEAKLVNERWLSCSALRVPKLNFVYDR